MIAVIFEVELATDKVDAYLAHAGQLRPALELMDGFISVERFKSTTNADKLVSLSFWRDESAVRAWREHAAHRATQAEGRSHIFTDYRLRVAEVRRDYGLYQRDEAPPYHPPVALRAPRAPRCPISSPTEF
jgi:heme-degrading monooxygenase HmoA